MSARFLDRGEAKLRDALQRTKGGWNEVAPAARVLIALTISLCVVASIYGTYHEFPLAFLVH
jgi:hypothetical protein